MIRGLDQKCVNIWTYSKWRPGRNGESQGCSLCNLGPNVSHASPPPASVLQNLPGVYTQPSGVVGWELRKPGWLNFVSDKMRAKNRNFRKIRRMSRLEIIF